MPCRCMTRCPRALAPLLALALVRLMSPPALADRPSEPIRLVAVHIVSRTGEADAVADDQPKRARADAGVTLHAVLEATLDRRTVYFSDAPRIQLRGQTHLTQPMASAPLVALLWYKVEPTAENLSNTVSGAFRFESIDYRSVLMRSFLLRTSAPADVRPTLTSDRGHGVGTMRYQLRAFTAQGVLSTPGPEAHRGPGSGGLDDTVHRVSLRRDDSFLGVMTEMYGQPYIWASAGVSDRAHQSERLEGADCADLMVYGARRKGYDVPYTWTGGLSRFTVRLAAGRAREDGVYVDDRGRPLPFTRPGDLILFTRHVGALVADHGVPGVLDTADVMMHTLFASPREQPIAESGYAGTPIELVRWRRPLER